MSYNYAVEVRNTFKGLDLVGRVPEELWWRFMVLYKAVIKTIPKKKEMKKGKMVV